MIHPCTGREVNICKIHFELCATKVVCRTKGRAKNCKARCKRLKSHCCDRKLYVYRYYALPAFFQFQATKGTTLLKALEKPMRQRGLGHKTCVVYTTNPRQVVDWQTDTNKLAGREVVKYFHMWYICPYIRTYLSVL